VHRKKKVSEKNLLLKNKYKIKKGAFFRCTSRLCAILSE
jgi:hypothetical protein